MPHTRSSARSRPPRPRRTVDPCPLCAVDLGGARGGTRRIALSGRERGRFVWECPECGGRWEQGPGKQRAVALRQGRRPGELPPDTSLEPRRPVD
jgi:hypothetical protein